MKIVGSSKQEGTPKPDNPVPITNETVLIITDKEGNKKEMPFKYEKILKEDDKIEKINGKWCLVRRKPMNEEEIIKNIKEMIQWSDHNTYKIALQGILDLYEQEKARNKNLEQIEQEHKEENGRLREENEVLRYGLRENKILRHGLEKNTEEIDKLYKIINLMAEHIEKGCDFDNRIQTKQQILDYFTNKVEEDK